MQSSKRLSGMPGFTVVWLGQIISVLASMMTQFALTIWAFERTGSATALGLMEESNEKKKRAYFFHYVFPSLT